MLHVLELWFITSIQYVLSLVYLWDDLFVSRLKKKTGRRVQDAPRKNPLNVAGDLSHRGRHQKYFSLVVNLLWWGNGQTLKSSRCLFETKAQLRSSLWVFVQGTFWSLWLMHRGFPLAPLSGCGLKVPGSTVLQLTLLEPGHFKNVCETQTVGVK